MLAPAENKHKFTIAPCLYYNIIASQAAPPGLAKSTNHQNAPAMNEIINREITPFNDDDSFLVFDRRKHGFDFPLHFHPEYELNFVRNAAGALRVVGDSTEAIDDIELVLLGPNLPHYWDNGHSNTSLLMHEVTIQFQPDIFSDSLLRRKIFRPIHEMLTQSTLGIAFSTDTARSLEHRILQMSAKSGFGSFIELQSLLYELALSRGQRTLSSAMAQTREMNQDERMIKLHNYIRDNYQKRLMLKDVADLLNMSTISFTRFIKQRTGRSYIDYLNDIRLGYAARMLIETGMSVSEICFNCGFNNISNFNRIFKRTHGKTPTEYRMSFEGIRTVF